MSETTTGTTTAAETTAARMVLAALTACEVDGTLSPDARRVLRDETDALRAAVESERHDHPKYCGDPVRLAAAVAEARRVAAMWGVTL